METPYVTIVAPCRNEVGFIDGFLEAVCGFEPVTGGGVEILVVDGLSTDGTREKLAEWEHRLLALRVLDNPQNNVPTAMNIGIRAARGQVLVRLDVHSTYPADYLRLCVETSGRTAAESVGGMFVTLPRGRSLSAAVVRAVTTHVFGVGNSGFRVNAAEGPADTVAYGCFPMSVFERVGLFDERLVRNQDYEFHCRIRRCGGVVWMNPAIRVGYYNQEAILGLMKQAFTTGRWNTWMWYAAPYTLAARHAIPGLFVLALLAGLVFVPVSPWAITWLACALGVYAICALLAALQQSVRYTWWLLFALPLAFLGYHLAYGTGILWGVVRLLFRASPVGRHGQQHRGPLAEAGRLRATRADCRE